MTIKQLEIERKYDISSAFGMPDLTGLSGIDSVDVTADLRLDATYYDTRDLRLAAHATTLRRRRGGDDEGWHLKQPAAADRAETRAPLSEDLPHSLA